MRLLAVTLTADFVKDDDEFLTPVRYGPIVLTAREWSELNLQDAAEDAIRNNASTDNKNLPG